jgi:hypothetical protein
VFVVSFRKLHVGNGVFGSRVKTQVDGARRGGGRDRGFRGIADTIKSSSFVISDKSGDINICYK